MEEELEPFVVHGTRDNPEPVEAGDVLGAIAKGQDIDISHAVINGNLYIEDELNQNEDGRWVISGNVKIVDSKFSGNAYFSSAKFSRYAGFGETTFEVHAEFRQSRFDGNALFQNSDFKQRAKFDRATFKGRVYFQGARFGLQAGFDGVIMEYAANFADISFSENTILTALWNYVIYPILHPMIRKLQRNPVTDFSLLDTSVVIDRVSNPHIVRYINDEQWLSYWRKRSYLHQVPFAIWLITSYCGRSIGLWLFWVLVAVLMFGVVYADYTVPSWVPRQLQDLLANMDPKIEISRSTEGATGSWFTPYYFSIVTFTTLGFGDVKPLNMAGEVFVSIEVIFSYVMVTMGLSAIANNLWRRS